ncbi:MAG TPA: TetR/AcrR family transcriptional regulator [Saprospiraceae bacterium]|nr:TetR/AcrR family transcriptional regulator [Saprospiraceae bacterium]
MSSTLSRKEEIRNAAAKLFGEKGFAASSVRDIAQAVGLGAASLYNHMESKDELLVTICFRCADAFSKGMQEIDSSGLNPLEKIKALVRLQMDIALHDQSSVTVFNDEWRHMHEPHLTAFRQLRRAYETAYLRIIRDGMEAGLIEKRDPDLTYQFILSSLRWLHQSGVRKVKLTETEINEQIISLIIKGIQV